MNPGGAWAQRVREIMEYVLADKGRKHQADLRLVFFVVLKDMALYNEN